MIDSEKFIDYAAGSIMFAGAFIIMVAAFGLLTAIIM